MAPAALLPLLLLADLTQGMSRLSNYSTHAGELRDPMYLQLLDYNMDFPSVVSNERVAPLLKQSVDKKESGLGCNLSPEILEEIAGYQEVVDKIIEYVMVGDHKGITYDTMVDFVDTFGHRLMGSEALESSIDWVQTEALLEGFDEVHGESVVAPHWHRNEESAVMVKPRVQPLNMLGLGTSVGTPPEGITADVLVVSSFDELAQNAHLAVGKIVVYNQGFESYGQSASYRTRGASEAAKVGAVAALVRSAASFSIWSPHTGSQSYEEGCTKIPVACIAVEDANLLQRLYASGKAVRVTLRMGAENLPPATSRNTVIDYLGHERPQDVVVMAGHIDSWDVGSGAMDDAGGSFVSYHAAVVLRRLALRPRRTVRTIWFSAEEQGIYGGYEYFEQHKNESNNFQLMLESDGGTFDPYGIAFTGSEAATCVMRAVVALTHSINTTQLVTPGDGPDIGMWTSVGVPIGSLYLDNERYFWFHHSAGDTLDLEDRDTLDRITALWAAVAYVTADMSVDLQDV